MAFFFQLLGILAGVLFPVFLINAIKAENKEKSMNHAALAGICFGFVIFVVIGSINR